MPRLFQKSISWGNQGEDLNGGVPSDNKNNKDNNNCYVIYTNVSVM